MGLFEHFPYVNFHELNLDWIVRFVKQVRDRLDLIDAAVKDAQDARDESEASALDSEAWAVGTKNGQPLDSDTPQYENNSKYYAQEAATQANAAADFADDAEAWATGNINGQPVASDAPQHNNNAEYWAQQAETAAQDTTQADTAKGYAEEAEAWARGTIDGVPVANTADQYENNSKYWANQAANSASTAASEAGTAVLQVSDVAFEGVARVYIPNVTVKASRTLYNGGNVQGTLNIPGLICICLPYKDTTSAAISENSAVKFNYITHIIGAHAVGMNMLRTNKYLIEEVYDGFSNATLIDGEYHDNHFFTVYDYSTGSFATDGTTFDLEILAIRTSYKTSGTANNGDNVGN